VPGWPPDDDVLDSSQFLFLVCKVSSKDDQVLEGLDPTLAVQLVELIARFWQTTPELVVKSMLNGDDSVAAILAGLMRLDPKDVADVVASVVIGYNGEVIRKRISAAYQ
jgi:hypothetical protein